MSVITHRNSEATASDFIFARQRANGHLWRRTKALVRYAYGPLIVYAALAIALVTVIAVKVAVWVPQLWHWAICKHHIC